jgi:hypothetical protein
MPHDWQWWQQWDWQWHRWTEGTRASSRRVVHSVLEVLCECWRCCAGGAVLEVLCEWKFDMHRLYARRARVRHHVTLLINGRTVTVERKRIHCQQWQQQQQRWRWRSARSLTVIGRNLLPTYDIGVSCSADNPVQVRHGRVCMDVIRLGAHAPVHPVRTDFWLLDEVLLDEACQ